MRVLLPLACCLLLTTAALAQAPTPAKPITDATPVVDAGGNPLPAIVWRKMLATYDYKFVPGPGYTPTAPVLRVVARSPEEKAAYLAKMPPPAASPFFTTGEKLAAFKLRDVNGRKYESKELAGKIVVLNFWFIGCPPCRAEIPELNHLVQQNAQRDDVVFIAVALDERPAIQAFTKEHPYEYALVPGGRYIAERYGIRSFPTNVVVDRQGQVVFHAQYHPNMAVHLQKAIDAAK
ncbi:MAG TPA: TlpA disulfide reductase family protein [Hymenobacter sp.]|jgi:peroxiredoxin